jgi:hypothetical protein
MWRWINKCGREKECWKDGSNMKYKIGQKVQLEINNKIKEGIIMAGYTVGNERFYRINFLHFLKTEYPDWSIFREEEIISSN